MATSPKALLRAVFFYNGKNFCLRGGTEHRGLNLSQFTRCSDPDNHYIYTEKIDREGLLNILDTYISKLPEEVKKRTSMLVLFLQYLLILKKNIVCTSKNSLNTMKDMCSKAGITGRKTNHSLRATGASELFATGVSKKIIKERTGHRSLDVLHIYEYTTSTQHQAASTILGSRNKISFQEALLTSSAPANIFNNCFIQVIQTTQPLHLHLHLRASLILHSTLPDHWMSALLQLTFNSIWIY